MSIWLDLKYKLKGEDQPTERNILYGDAREAFRGFTKTAIRKVTGGDLVHGYQLDTYGYGKRFGDNFSPNPNPNRNEHTVKITDQSLIQLLAKEYYDTLNVAIIERIVTDPKGIKHLCMEVGLYGDIDDQINQNQFDDMDINIPDDYKEWSWCHDIKTDPWGCVEYDSMRRMIVKELNPELFEELTQLKNGQLLFGHPIEDFEWIEYSLS